MSSISTIQARPSQSAIVTPSHTTKSNKDSNNSTMECAYNLSSISTQNAIKALQSQSNIALSILEQKAKEYVSILTNFFIYINL